MINSAKSQTVEILFSIPDSCVNTSENLTLINVEIDNWSDEDFWIDIEAINFSIFENERLVMPFQESTIGMFSPKEKASKNGFVLVRGGESENFRIYSSLFKNYTFEKSKKYLLQASYKKVRNKFFKNVFNEEKSIGAIDLLICF